MVKKGIEQAWKQIYWAESPDTAYWLPDTIVHTIQLTSFSLWLEVQSSQLNWMLLNDFYFHLYLDTALEWSK